MADTQVGNIHGVTVVAPAEDPNKTNLNNDDANPQTSFADRNLDHIDAMRTRLAAIDEDYYTSERLNSMTYNDLVYAIRVADHEETIR